MNRTKLVALGCGAAIAALLTGCGGGSNGNATISGSVSGLTPNTSIVLTDNGANNLTVTGNAASSVGFTFAQTIASQGSYNVQVATQPANQTCSVTNGSGVVDFSGDPIGNVAVACSNNATLNAVVSGLDAKNSVVLSLTLQNDPLTALQTTVTGNGTVNFTNASGATVTLPLGTLYVVSVATQPTNPTQVCTVSGSTPASGGVVSVDGTTVDVTIDFNCQ